MEELMEMEEPSTVLLFLHGSGGNGFELRTFLECVPIEEFVGKTFRETCDVSKIDIVTPTSDLRNYKPNMNIPTNVWFNRSSEFLQLGLNDSYEDIEGVDESINKIMVLLNDLSRQYKHIVVGGFSMGGCLALHLLRFKLPGNIRGIFSIGSFIIKPSILNSSTITSENKKIPLYMLHGEDDEFIKLEWGRHTATTLHLREIDVQFKDYKGLTHEIGIEQLVDLIYWIEDLTVQIDKVEMIYNSNVGLNTNNNNNYYPPSIYKKMSREGEIINPGRNSIHKNIDMDKTIPYILTNMNDKTKISYTVPHNIDLEIITSRPVLACGGMFYISVEDNRSSVFTVVTSADPHKTAMEIGIRLRNRLKSEGNSLNPCPMM